MGHRNAADFEMMGLIREIGDDLGWYCGVRSMAHWLNWRCGIALSAARERVRVAYALPALPLTSSAFRRGELSYSKVRALTRAATPENEAELLNIARCGTASHLERVVRGYRTATSEERAERQAKRELRCYFDDDGMLVIKGRLTPEEGAVVMRALEVAKEALDAEPLECPEDVSAETSDDVVVIGEPPDWDAHDATQADAFSLIARSFVAQGPAEHLRGEPIEAIVHIDASGLGPDPSRGCAYFEDGAGLSPAEARRLTCDAALVPMIETSGGEPLSIGRRRRTIPVGLRRALDSRDRSCRFPGCAQHRHLHAHHIVHWADGGETALNNLVYLCSFHHRLLHDGAYRVERETGAGLFRFVDGAGHWLSPAPDTERATPDVHGQSLRDLLGRHGVTVTPNAADCGWSGERFDLDHILWVLCDQAERVTQ
ncbi:MAG: DUF222 domain-containing protein [Chromatiales bacterium]|nr:DUF222 domain-containing protein [Chromatiales bacterium]